MEGIGPVVVGQAQGALELDAAARLGVHFGKVEDDPVVSEFDHGNLACGLPAVKRPSRAMHSTAGSGA